MWLLFADTAFAAVFLQDGHALLCAPDSQLKLSGYSLFTYSHFAYSISSIATLSQEVAFRLLIKKKTFLAVSNFQ